MARKIVEHELEGLVFPPSCCKLSAATKDMIKWLLAPDPRRRFGGEGGAQVRESSCLTGMDWGQLANGSLQSVLTAQVAQVRPEKSAEPLPKFPPVGEAVTEWCSAEFS